MKFPETVGLVTVIVLAVTGIVLLAKNVRDLFRSSVEAVPEPPMICGRCFCPIKGLYESNPNAMQGGFVHAPDCDDEAGA